MVEYDLAKMADDIVMEHNKAFGKQRKWKYDWPNYEMMVNDIAHKHKGASTFETNELPKLTNLEKIVLHCFCEWECNGLWKVVITERTARNSFFCTINEFKQAVSELCHLDVALYSSLYGTFRRPLMRSFYFECKEVDGGNALFVAYETLFAQMLKQDPLVTRVTIDDSGVVRPGYDLDLFLAKFELKEG